MSNKCPKDVKKMSECIWVPGGNVPWAFANLVGAVPGPPPDIWKERSAGADGGPAGVHGGTRGSAGDHGGSRALLGATRGSAGGIGRGPRRLT